MSYCKITAKDCEFARDEHVLGGVMRVCSVCKCPIGAMMSIGKPCPLEDGS